MGKILIKNCNLLSMDNKRDRYEQNIDILISGEIIEKIDIDINEKVDKVIDARSNIVMPGIVNTHAHLAMSLFKNTADGYNLQDWLEQVAWPIESNLTDKDIYYLTYLSCIEMIKTGTTTVNNHYYLTESAIKAEQEAKINALETRCLMDNDKNGKIRLEELEELIHKYKEYDNINICVGIHGLYTSTEEYIKKAIQIAIDNNLPVHMHFCENIKEVENIKKEYNVESPVQVITKYFKNTHNILAHCVQLTKEDIQILKKLNINVSHCPASNLKLGCGIANIKEMVGNGINVTLGTDGQGSGDNMDMFQSIKLAALLSKITISKERDLNAYNILEFATKNGAKALNMNNRGVISKGNKADIIVLDLANNVSTFPVNDPISDIVYNASGYNVVTTIINGNIIMEDRKLLHINEEEIKKECSKIVEKLIK